MPAFFKKLSCLKTVCSFILLFILVENASAQLVVSNTNPNNNPTFLVQNVLMGSGVTASNILFNGSTNTSTQIGFFNGVNSNIGLDSGIVLSTGKVTDAVGPNSSNGQTTNFTGGADHGSDVDLNTIVGSSSGNQDKAVLEFDFIPIGDSVKFTYVFASEEYPDFVNSFDDVFGFFISGPGITGPFSNNSQNIALIPGTTTPVSINTVNDGQANGCPLSLPGPCTNCADYVNNCGGLTVQYDGFTTTLEAIANVQCGKTYHIKIAIEDVGDGAFDSGVFLKAQSFTSPGVQVSLNTVLGDNNMNEGCADAYINFVRVDTDSVQVVHYQISGTATNGLDYVQIPDSVVFAVGQDSAQITVSLLSDTINEGTETIIITVFNIIPCTGDTLIETATLFIHEGYDLTMSSVDKTVLCALDPISISSTASGGATPYSYNWDNGMTGSPITVTPSVTDSFIVTATDKIGCRGVDTVVVTVQHPQPTAKAGSDSSLCTGNSLQIGGTPTGPPGSTFSWAPSGTLSSSTAANPTATPTSTTTYIVTVTDTNTCKNKDTIIVKVNSLPVAKAGNDTTLCTGSSVQIGGSPTGPTGSAFSWAPPGTLNNSTLANPTATPVANTSYIVTVTDTNSCKNKDTVVVSLFAPPVAVASNDTTICSGDTAQLSSSGGVSFSWSPSSGLSATNISNPKAFPLSTTTFIVTVTDNNNCKDTESVKITVNNLPAADAGVSTAICTGNTIQIGGSPTGPAGSGFSWLPNTNISSTTVSNPNVFPSSTTTYFVTVTDVNSCKKTDSVKITVNNLPVAKAGNDTSVCPGSSVTIGGSPTGPVGSTFSWSPSGTLSNSSLANPTATPVASTTYIVTVTDGNTCVNKDTVIVSLFTPPVAVASNDTSICKGDTIQLTSSGGISFSWSPSSGLSSTNISNPKAFPLSTTNFIVTVTDNNNCKDTESVKITVNNLPVVDAGVNKSICKGDTVQIGGAPTAPAGSTFSWSPNTNISSTTISNPNVFPSSTITYFVTATDVNTCKNKDSVKVTVNNLPVVKAGNDTTICTGSSAIIGGSPTGPVGSTFSWAPSGTLNNGTLANPTATPVSNTTYIVTATDGNSCKNKDTVIISLFTLPVAAANNDTSICTGDTIQLSASGGISFSWGPSSGLSATNISNPKAFPSSNTTYIVTVTDANTCKDTESVFISLLSLPAADAGNNTAICIGNSVQIGGAPTGPVGATFVWAPAGTLNNSSLANPTATPITTTSYIVTVTDINTCKKKDTIVVTVNNLPVVKAGNDTTICTGSSAIIGGSPTGPVGSTFSWAPSGTLNNGTLANPTATPVSNTTYIVTATDGNSCKNKDTVIVSLFSPPVAVASNDTAICIGDTIQLSASGGISFSWGPSSGLSATNISNPKAFPSSNTTYIVTVTDANTCKDTESVFISLLSLPVADAGSNTAICIGNSVQIGGAPTGPVGATFVWAPAGTLNNSSLANPMATPITTTSYIVTVTDINTCKKKDTIVVTVNNLPVVKAGNDTTICTGSSATIGGSPTGPVGSTFSWAPSGTLNNSSLANPTATPVANTTYIVTVTDGNTCVNKDTVKVSLFSPPVAVASNDTAICIGDTIQLSSSGGVSFSWSPSLGLSATNISNPLAFPLSTTTYTVTVTDANTCTDTEKVIIIVNNLPVVDAGNDTAICIGDTIQIGGLPTSTTGVNFNWSPVTNLSSTSVANPNAFPVSTITYTVLVTDGNTCKNADSIKISVNNLPVVDAGNDTTICNGFSVVIGGNPTGPLNSTFSWSPSTSLSSSTVSNPTATPSSNITYTVTVTDTNTCVNSDSVKFIVNANPVADAGAGGTLCVNDSIQLNGSGGGTYSWTPNDSLTNPNISNPIAFPSDAITYFLIVTDANNCKDTDSVTVNVNQLPPADAGPDSWVCPGDSVTLSASGGVIYSWSPSTGLSATNIFNPKASPADTTEYFVTVTDGNGCVKIDSMKLDVGLTVPTDAGPNKAICINDTAQIGGNPTAPAGSTLSWNTSSGLSDTSIANPFAFPQDTVTYYVTTKNFTCTGFDSVMIVVNPLPIVDAGNNTAICIGDTTLLTATAAVSFVWTPADSLTDDSISNPFAFPSDTTTFFVTGTDVNGCKNSDSVKIIVNPLPNVTVTADSAGSAISGTIAICIGDSTQLNASGGINYNWSPADSLTNANISNPVVFPSDTTTYIVTVTDGNNCKNKDSITVIINPLPVISITGNLKICIGDTTQLTASGGNNYSWLPTDSLSNPNISNPFAFPSDTTTYVVTVVDSNSCVNKDSATVIVNFLPLVDAGNDTAVCIGDTTLFTATATAAVSFVWTPTDSLSNPNISNPTAFPSDTTEYFVTGTDANGCNNSDSVKIIVNPLPTIITSSDTEICIGDSTQLFAAGGVSYSWSPQDSLTNPFLFNPVAFPGDTIVYVVTVSDGNNCVNKDSVTVTVNSLPSVSITGNLIICIGDTTQLTASGGNNYSWVPADSLSNPNISNPFAFPSDTTTYVVAVTDGNNCVNKDSATVIVNFLPLVDAGNDTSICIGDTALLTATATAAVSFVWNPADSLSNLNISNPFAFPANTVTYFVTGTNNNNCSNNDSIKIIVNTLPNADAGSDTTACSGDSVQLSATGGIIYLWSPATGLSDDSISNPFVTISGTMEYFVSVTDTNGCSKIDSITVGIFNSANIDAGNDTVICFSDTVQLNASGGNSYSWTPVSNLSNPNIFNPLAFPQSTTPYIVSAVDTNGCSGKDTVLISVNPQLNVDAGTDTSVCSGDTIQLNATGATNYLWNPVNDLSNPGIANPSAFPANSITYFVAGTDTSGCTNSDSIVITVNSLPTANAGNDTTSCSGASVQLNATGGIIYNWSPATGLNNANIANPTATLLSDSIMYIVTVTDTSGCKDLDSVIIKAFSIAINPDTSICTGDSAKLIVTVHSGFSPYTYLWAPSSGLNNSIIANPFAAPASSTTYFVKVTESSGCADSAGVSVFIKENPTADFTFKLEPSCIGAVAEFKNKSVNADSYLWLFGDGTATDKENPEHKFLYNQQMDVTLVAINNSGCDDSSSVTQNIKSFDDYFDIVVPNVFTPDGDGKNDWFEIRFDNKLQECSDVKIFNRWGEMIFSSSGNQHSWNGRTFAGEEAPNGTYFFIFDINGKQFKGAVTLIR